MSARGNAGEQRQLLLSVLLRCLWGLTLDQAVRLLACSPTTVRRLVAQLLERERLVEVISVTHPRAMPPAAVLGILRPGERHPEPILRHAIAQAARRLAAPLIVSPAVIATPRCARRHGGHPGKRLRTSESSHNYALGDVFLHYREHCPALAVTWVDERTLLRERPSWETSAPLPDARVVTSDDAVRYVEQVGKNYSYAHLQQLWQWVESEEAELELW